MSATDKDLQAFDPEVPADWRTIYRHCRVCFRELPESLFSLACHRYTQLTCSAECDHAEFMKLACCPKAAILPCVCTYSFTCPDHGNMHIGSHD